MQWIGDQSPFFFGAGGWAEKAPAIIADTVL
jgi:hypothetical protein